MCPNIYTQIRAGYGRFGCRADCGTFYNTTTMYVDLRDMWEDNPEIKKLAQSKDAQL